MHQLPDLDVVGNGQGVASDVHVQARQVASMVCEDNKLDWRSGIGLEHKFKECSASPQACKWRHVRFRRNGDVKGITATVAKARNSASHKVLPQYLAKGNFRARANK